MTLDDEREGPITRELLDRLFILLDRRLREKGITLDMYLFGGANMVYSYHFRARTNEVDSGVRRNPIVDRIFKEVGEELGLPSNWIDRQSPRFLPQTPDSEEWVVVDLPNLRVGAASAKHMLAMKLMAGRDKDWRDIEFLIGHLDIGTLAEVREVFGSVWPGEEMPQETVDGLIERRLAADEPEKIVVPEVEDFLLAARPVVVNRTRSSSAHR